MASKCVAMLLADLGVAKTTVVRTCPTTLFGEPVQDLEILPGISETIRLHGRCAIILSGVFAWYKHRPSSFGIAWLTPETVHLGRGEAVLTARRASERFVRGTPVVSATGSGLDQSSRPTEYDITITH